MDMRDKKHRVVVGGVAIGGDEPVRVQSMTNTPTEDVAATVSQIVELVAAGSELVRVTVNNEAAAEAVPKIRGALEAQGVHVPIIGDFHFNGHLLLKKFPQCAVSLDKYRINPGTVGRGLQHDTNFSMMVEAACQYGKPVRIGVNWGSLDGELLTKLMDENAQRIPPKSDDEVVIEALVESALQSAQRAVELGLAHDKIILSIKASQPAVLIASNKLLTARCDFPLHIGLTEAGSGMKGIVASSAALGVLLSEGIGDTIRISLTPAPGESRAREVEACRLLLQSLGIRHFTPLVTSCPGCGRTSSNRYQTLTQEVNEYIARRMPEWKNTCPGVERMMVAVMGCVVNGPGESRHADIAISLPGGTPRPGVGASHAPRATVFSKGTLLKTLAGDSITQEFLALLEEFVHTTYAPRA